MSLPSVFSSSSLHVRTVTPERMDDPALDPRAHEIALHGLRRLNYLGRASALLWPEIRLEVQQAEGRTLTLLDVACGGGEVLRALQGRAEGRLECLGVDLSSRALEFAQRRSPPSVRFVRLDVLHEPLPPADIVTCNLFLHHLRDDDAQSALESMARAAGRLLILSDLERSRFAWCGVWVAARILTRSSVVHSDGERSVRAAFSRDELESLALRAGLLGVRVCRKFPFRLILVWRPPSGR